MSYKGFLTQTCLLFLVGNLLGQVGTPLSLLPENNSDNISTESVYFEWNLADSAEFYQLVLDNNEDFATPIVQELVYSLSEEIHGVFNNWQFYWKVRAGRIDEAGEQEFGNWSVTYSFTTIYESATNLSPLDSSIVDNYFSANLEWELYLDPSINEPENYYIQLSRDDSFTDIIRDLTVNNSKTVLIEDLEQNTGYYWRVKYLNSFGESNWSEMTYFITKASDLEQVSLQYPENNENEIYPLSVLFQWESISAAEGYNFELATDSLFVNLIESGALIEAEYITNIPIYNEKLYWRVQAETAIQIGNWSSVWSFTTSMAAPQMPPGLIYPQDLQNTSITDTLRFQWATVYSADSYFIEISLDENFSNLIYSETVVDTFEIVTQSFEEGKVYYWHVKSKNDDGDGPWSGQRSFSFGEVTDIYSTYFNPSFYLFSNYPNPFNPSTTIEYTVVEKSKIVLSVYNNMGQRIKVLKNDVVNAGLSKSTWDGTNSSGIQVSSGLFFYRLEATGINSNNHYAETKKMLKIK